MVETWRKAQGAYAREGLVVTPDLSHQSVEEVSRTLVHEMSHQWWGLDALPGEEWFQEDWLSEGLATYCTYLWIRDKLGDLPGAEFLRAAGTSVHGMTGSLARSPPWSPTGWSLTRFGGLLALSALESQVPNLSERLRRFRQQHDGSFLTTEALIRELSASVPGSWL